MKSGPSEGGSTYRVPLMASKASPENGSFTWVYVESHNTVTQTGTNKYTFGAGTRLQVLASKYYKQSTFILKLLAVILEEEGKVNKQKIPSEVVVLTLSDSNAGRKECARACQVGLLILLELDFLRKICFSWRPWETPWDTVGILCSLFFSSKIAFSVHIFHLLFLPVSVPVSPLYNSMPAGKQQSRKEGDASGYRAEGPVMGRYFLEKEQHWLNPSSEYMSSHSAFRFSLWVVIPSCWLLSPWWPEARKREETMLDTQQWCPWCFLLKFSFKLPQNRERLERITRKAHEENNFKLVFESVSSLRKEQWGWKSL